MKIAESDSGRKIRILLKEYLHYVIRQSDDDPLYLFESEFSEKSDTRKMLDNYSTPKYFCDDYFNHLSEEKRPPHRWFLIGPKRSGSK